MVITSLENNEIKRITKLNKKKYREEYKEFLVEGVHLVEEACKANLLKKVILLEGSSYDFDIDTIVVNKAVMKKISMLESIPNIIGICKFKKEEELGKKVLMLDDVQDPGNLGTIIRSSLAFNVDTIILSDNTVDIYNSKTIRATQGMIFNINIIRRNLISEINKLKKEKYSIYTTDVKNGTNLKEIERKDKYVVIMGNEGNGVRKELSSLADFKINIKMNQKAESLNVGVATSIILYELDK